MLEVLLPKILVELLLDECYYTADLMDAFKANLNPGADIALTVDEKGTIFYEHCAESTGTFGDEWLSPEIDRFALRKT